MVAVVAVPGRNQVVIKQTNNHNLLFLFNIDNIDFMMCFNRFECGQPEAKCGERTKHRQQKNQNNKMILFFFSNILKIIFFLKATRSSNHQILLRKYLLNAFSEFFIFLMQKKI